VQEVRQRPSTIPLRWSGQNWGNISVYIKDARAEELPLVGGGEHEAIVLGWRALSGPRAELRSSVSPG
jgi:hypothetical protein